MDGRTGEAHGVEHRLSPRKGARVKVYFSLGKQPMQRCSTRNLSSGGVFLETRLPLRLNTPVQLLFVLNRGVVIRIYRLSAIVVRLSKDGIGLMFCKRSPASRRA